MKALIIGLGSIGKRHLANLRRLLPDGEIVVLRHELASSPHGIDGADRVVYDLESALSSLPEVAILASPAPFHVSAAACLATAGVHLLIEKPLSDSMLGVSDLLALCRQKQLVLMVGYNLRFQESLRALHCAVSEGRVGRLLSIRAEVGWYLPDWRPGIDYHRIVSARPELGGGAVLELSHEIDYVRWLGGEVTAVSGQLAQVGGFGLEVEDIAEITLRLANGGLAQIHVDMLQRTPHRSCRVIGTDGTLVWDALSDSVMLFDSQRNGWEAVVEPHASDRNAMYLAELEHFIDCVRDGRAPLVTGEDGSQVLQIALSAKRSSEEQRTILL